MMRRAVRCGLAVGVAVAMLGMLSEAAAQTGGDGQSAACQPAITRVQAARADHAAPGRRPTGGWQTVTLPDRWADARWPDHTGSVWYRIEWENPCLASPAGAPPRLALMLESVSMAGEVWLGDELLWRDTSLVEPLSRSWNMPRMWLLPSALLAQPSHTLWVRVVGVAALSPGLGTVTLGDPAALGAALEARWWRLRTLFMLNLVLSGALGMLMFFVWLMRREQSAYGWYALLSLCWVLFIANVLVETPWPFGTSLSFARANAVLMVLYVACFCVFAWRFGQQCWPRTERALWALVALLALALGSAPAAQLPLALLVATLFSAMVFIGSCTQFIVHALRTRVTDHLLMATCFASYIVVAVHDLAVVLRLLPDGTPWTPYTSPVAMAALSAVLGWRIAHNTRRVERFNDELQTSISRARADLGATLAREHAMALANTRLQERLSLAHELHDGLGGSLVRSMAMVEQAPMPLGNPQFLSILKLLRDDLRQVIDSGSSGGASVPATPQAWMAPLRHRFGTLLGELDMASDWRYPPAWLEPPSALQCLTLTRVVEEALVNVSRHSRARRVQVELDQTDDGKLTLRIADDGVGFDVGAVQQASLSVGTRSMQARMARVGGTLELASQPGRTVLTARLQPRQSESAPVPLAGAGSA